MSRCQKILSIIIFLSNLFILFLIWISRKTDLLNNTVGSVLQSIALTFHFGISVVFIVVWLIDLLKKK